MGLGGFRALKKTPEAPYTTKVKYRELTSRGTTPRPNGGEFRNYTQLENWNCTAAATAPELSPRTHTVVLLFRSCVDSSSGT